MLWLNINHSFRLIVILNIYIVVPNIYIVIPNIYIVITNIYIVIPNIYIVILDILKLSENETQNINYNRYSQ